MTLPLYSTDLDALEFVYSAGDVVPVALIEKKWCMSQWKNRWTGPMQAQFALAQKPPPTPYYVAEHNKIRSHWCVYRIRTMIEPPSDNDIVMRGLLYDYVIFLCNLHNYDPPAVIKEKLRCVEAIDSNGQSVSSWTRAQADEDMDKDIVNQEAAWIDEMAYCDTR